MLTTSPDLESLTVSFKSKSPDLARYNGAIVSVCLPKLRQLVVLGSMGYFVLAVVRAPTLQTPIVTCTDERFIQETREDGPRLGHIHQFINHILSTAGLPIDIDFVTSSYLCFGACSASGTRFFLTLGMDNMKTHINWLTDMFRGSRPRGLISLGLDADPHLDLETIRDMEGWGAIASLKLGRPTDANVILSAMAEHDGGRWVFPELETLTMTGVSLPLGSVLAMVQRRYDPELSSLPFPLKRLQCTMQDFGAKEHMWWRNVQMVVGQDAARLQVVYED